MYSDGFLAIRQAAAEANAVRLAFCLCGRPCLEHAMEEGGHSPRGEIFYKFRSTLCKPVFSPDFLDEFLYPSILLSLLPVKMHLTTLIFPALAVASAITIPAALEPRATATCARDNCYQAISHRWTSSVSPASAFCATYTATPTATIAAAVTSQCVNNPSRVSSACSCLATDYYAAKSFHQVYGPVDGTSYTYYDDAMNIRSDDYPSLTYDQALANCRLLCTGDCNLYSFEDVGFYLVSLLRLATVTGRHKIRLRETS
jgi:hypothetical protein